MRQFALLLTLLALVPSTALAYGEGESIPADARAIHLLINESRTDTKAALADCGTNCLSSEKYDAVIPPLYWDDGLHRAAQFHANMQAYVGGACLTHNSPCKLKSTVADDFPDTCDGNPACACQDGKATCETKGTDTFARVRMFTNLGGAMAENIAWSGYIPVNVHFQFLHENGKQTYGHRANILDPGLRAIGIGRHTKWTVEDFAGNTNVKSAISAGAYYYSSDKSELWFKAHYYDDVAASEAKVSIHGSCSVLSLTLGTNKHGVWGIDADTPAKCTAYFYEIKDTNGTITRYPTTGSLLFDCETSWQAAESASCFGNVDTPTNPDDGGENEGTGDPESPDDGGENEGTGDPESPDDGGENEGTGDSESPDDGGENEGTGDPESPDDGGENEDTGDSESPDDGGNDNVTGDPESPDVGEDNDGSGESDDGSGTPDDENEQTNAGTDSDCSVSPYGTIPSHGGLFVILGMLAALGLRRRKQHSSF